MAYTFRTCLIFSLLLTCGMHAARANCLPAIDAALAGDIDAALAEADKKPWSELEKRHAHAEQAWAAAVAQCPEAMREKAARSQADATAARARIARLLEHSAACDQAFTNAERAARITRDAWAEKRWDDAASWARKSDLAWESALAQCAGDKRVRAQAARDSARVDAHNALHCAPLWEHAAGLTARLKADVAATDGAPALSAGERATRQDQVENAWTEAAFVCKGSPAERALASAEALTKARGGRPLSVPPAATRAKEAGATAATAAMAKPLRGDGVNYIGSFIPAANGLVSGQGRVEWDNGDTFEGTLVDGLAQGKGVFNWKNGDHYEGSFLSGQPDGIGAYRWKSGDRYEGAWRQGKKHGKGRYTWADGRQSEGEYADNEPVAEASRAL